MDVGVGTFIVSSAITSPYARGQLPTRRAGSLQQSSPSRSIAWRRLVVLALGVARTIAVKSIGYQEHVSEYGVHWNFFLSLYCVWTIADGVHRAVPRCFVPWIALLIIVVYQLALVATPLTDFIIATPRTTLFSANREGIFSLLGFVPLYLLAETASFQMFFSGSDSLLDISSADASVDKSSVKMSMDQEYEAGVKSILDEDSGGQPQALKDDMTAPPAWKQLSQAPYRKIVAQLSVSTVVFWVCWAAGTTIQQTSRRLCNLPFIFCILALSHVLLLAIVVADIGGGGIAVKVATLEYFSSAQLSIFLCANFMTGLINASIRTIYVRAPTALLILLAYTSALAAVAWILNSKNNRIFTAIHS